MLWSRREILEALGDDHNPKNVSINLSERELLDDRMVQVLLLEWLGGLSMSVADPLEFNFQKRQQIREAIIHATKQVYAHGIYLINMTLDNFVIPNNDHIPRIHGFSFSKTLDELEDDEHEILPKIGIRGIKYFLDLVGFK